MGKETDAIDARLVAADSLMRACQEELEIGGVLPLIYNVIVVPDIPEQMEVLLDKLEGHANGSGGKNGAWVHIKV
jgi:hypothetical protein